MECEQCEVEWTGKIDMHRMWSADSTSETNTRNL